MTYLPPGAGVKWQISAPILKKYTYAVLFAFFLFFVSFPANYKINPLNGSISSVKAQMTSSTTNIVNEPSGAVLEEVEAILSKTSELVSKYGIRPPYKGQQFAKNAHLSSEQAKEVLPYILSCESQGRDVSEIDSNHKMSRGVSQFQDATWKERQDQSGIEGKPTQAVPAIAMSLWSLQNGFIGQWSCSRIEKIIK